MKGRAKGRALERRPFEKRHSKESRSCAGCVVGAVCAPESGDVWRSFGAPVISDCAEDAAVIESAYPKTL